MDPTLSFVVIFSAIVTLVGLAVALALTWARWLRM